MEHRGIDIVLQIRGRFIILNSDTRRKDLQNIDLLKIYYHKTIRNIEVLDMQFLD